MLAGQSYKPGKSFTSVISSVGSLGKMKGRAGGALYPNFLPHFFLITSLSFFISLPCYSYPECETRENGQCASQGRQDRRVGGGVEAENH